MLPHLPPMKAPRNVTRFRNLVASVAFLAACGRDVSAPSTQSPVAPNDPSKALVGIVDGVYSITVDPSQSYTIPLGSSYMVLPAHAICQIGVSGYGPSYWNSSCTPETKPVTITAVIRGAATDNPSVDFQPAMRFNPSTSVQLHIAVTNAATLTNMSTIKYCSTALLSSCIDESTTDPSLVSIVDPSAKTIWRRIKHFSGYLVSE